MKRHLILLSAVALVAAVVAAQAAESLRIVPIHADGEVLVSVEMKDLNVEEVLNVISSGLRTTITYDIELRMVVPGWIDRTVATAAVAISDQYDNLTRHHRLTRSIDGRVAETKVSGDDKEVSRWLTTLTRVPICETTKLDPNRDYYVRISARERPRGTTIFGWASAITGQAKFTFIP